MSYESFIFIKYNNHLCNLRKTEFIYYIYAQIKAAHISQKIDNPPIADNALAFLACTTRIIITYWTFFRPTTQRLSKGFLHWIHNIICIWVYIYIEWIYWRWIKSIRAHFSCFVTNIQPHRIQSTFIWNFAHSKIKLGATFVFPRTQHIYITRIRISSRAHVLCCETIDR